MTRPSRWEFFNGMVDEDLPNLTPAEFRLLVVYFRHSECRNSRPKSPEFGKWRNLFRLSDGEAARRIGIGRSSVKRTRLSLMSKGLVHCHKTGGGKLIWHLGDPL